MTNLPGRVPWRRFVAIFLPAALALTLVCVAAVLLDARHERTRIESREAARIEVAGKSLGRELRSVITDLRLIAGSRLFTRYVERGGEGARASLTAYLIHFAREKGA